MDVPQIIGWVFLVMACIGTAYAVAAGILVPLFLSRAVADFPPGAADFPAVTLLKPLRGNECDLRDNLATFCRQDYPGAVQVVFGVEDARDPALRTVDELKRMFPSLDIALVSGENIPGANRKIANVIGTMRAAKHEVLVLADSDISVGDDYLRRVVACLADGGVGAVTCLYRGKASVGMWSQLSSMAIDHHFLPGVVMGLYLGLAAPCFGSTIAFRRTTLERIGGFEPFADRLADDYEIGNAVRRAGFRIAIPPMVVSHACVECGFMELLRHELRWARTVRTVDRPGFAGSGVTHALPLALVGAGILGFSPMSLVIAAAAIAARLWMATRVDAALAVKPRSRLLFVARDLLSFFVYCATFFVRSVTWRDRRLRVGPERTIAQAEEH